MTTKMKLKWRLGRLPESQEIALLLEKELLTKDEAREILFSTEKEEDKDIKALEGEIKFLRELVEKLANNNSSRIVEVIRTVQVPYINYGWYHPYQAWCGVATSGTAGNMTSSGYTNTSFNTVSTGLTSAVPTSFKNIKTF